VRTTRIAVLSVWLGAIVFFAAAIAPNVFAVLSPHEGGRALAGDIVNRALTTLHYLGLGCGVVFILLAPKMRIANGLVLAMLLLTLVSQFGISRRMRAIRSEVVLDQLSPADPRRAEFDRLHKASTTTESAILMLGIAALVTDSRRKANVR
jgi:Domain of unknown function (DUF4149)